MKNLADEIELLIFQLKEMRDRLEKVEQELDEMRNSVKVSYPPDPKFPGNFHLDDKNRFNTEMNRPRHVWMGK